MYVTTRNNPIELVALKEIAERLDLAPSHLAKIVLSSLQVYPVDTNIDPHEWYFWSDVVAALIAVAKEEGEALPS